MALAPGAVSDAAEEDYAAFIWLTPMCLVDRAFSQQPNSMGCILNTQDIVVPLIEDEGPLWEDHRWSHLLRYVEWEGRAVRALFAGAGGAVNIHSSLYNIEPMVSLTTTILPDSSKKGCRSWGLFISGHALHSNVVDTRRWANFTPNVDVNRPIASEADYDIMDAAVEKLDAAMANLPENQRDSFLRNTLRFRSFRYDGFICRLLSCYTYTVSTSERFRCFQVLDLR
jgi:hypothetical protein